MMLYDDQIQQFEDTLQKFNESNLILNQKLNEVHGGFPAEEIETLIRTSLNYVSSLWVKLQLFQELDEMDPSDYLDFYTKYFQITRQLWQYYIQYRTLNPNSNSTFNTLLTHYETYFPHLLFETHTPVVPTTPPASTCVLF